MFDLTPKPNPTFDKAYVNYWIVYLHHSYLPVRALLVPLLLAVIVQLQSPIPRCGLLLAVQLASAVYYALTMKIKNVRTIKVLLLTAFLACISSLGLVVATSFNSGQSSDGFYARV